jgi:hypothetical protein
MRRRSKKLPAGLSARFLAAALLGTLLLGACENYFFNQILGERPASQPSSQIYAITVSVSPVEGGTVQPSRTEAEADADITLTVSPNPGYRLKPDSLKVNGSAVTVSGTGLVYAFTMPAEDAVVTAEFVEIPAGTWNIVISPMTGGYVTSNHSYAEEQSSVILAVNPEPGYHLKTGSLRAAQEGGGEVLLTEYAMGSYMAGTIYTFNMPPAHVTVYAEFEANPEQSYSISILPGISRGTVIPTLSSAAPGTSVALYIQPEPGYRLKTGSLSAPDVVFQTYQGVDAYVTFIMPAANVTVRAEFEAIPAAANRIEIAAMRNGNIIPTVFSALPGEQVFLYSMPEPGYRLKADTIQANGGAVSLSPATAGSVYTLVMPSSGVVISAEFEEAPGEVYAVRVTEDVAHGFIVPARFSAAAGDEVLFTTTPVAGYELKGGSVTVNNGAVSVTSMGPVYSFTMPAGDAVLAAEFTEIIGDVYSVTVSSLIRTGYVVTDHPAAAAGTLIGLGLMPYPGYRLKAGSLTVNGGAIAVGGPIAASGTGSVYTFIMPAAHVTVRAEFEVAETAAYTVTISAMTHGTVSPGAASAPEGTEVALTVAPDSGYGLKAGSLKVNGGAIAVSGSGTSYAFIMPAASVTVTAEFEAIRYPITVHSPMPNGTVTPSHTSAVKGTGVTLTVAPDSGYGLKAGSLKVNGGAIAVSGSGASHAFIMPAASVTVTAEFEVPGSGLITLALNDLGLGAFSQTTFIVNKGGTPNAAAQAVTLTGTWDPSPAPRWEIDNGLITQTGSSITIQAANLNTGGHSLTLTVYKNGVPWSKTLKFTVAN